MRVVHQTRADRPHAEPLCGDWGAMDTDWTDAADGVTCPDCRNTLRSSVSRLDTSAHERAIVARRAADDW